LFLFHDMEPLKVALSFVCDYASKVYTKWDRSLGCSEKQSLVMNDRNFKKLQGVHIHTTNVNKARLVKEYSACDEKKVNSVWICWSQVQRYWRIRLKTQGEKFVMALRKKSWSG
jgi:hypothetical protein